MQLARQAQRWHDAGMASILEKVRAWLRRREQGSEDPSKIDSGRQDALAAGAANLPPNYVPPADEGRPRH